MSLIDNVKLYDYEGRPLPTFERELKRGGDFQPYLSREKRGNPALVKREDQGNLFLFSEEGTSLKLAPYYSSSACFADNKKRETTLYQAGFLLMHASLINEHNICLGLMSLFFCFFTLTAAAKKWEFRLNALIETGMINTHFP